MCIMIPFIWRQIHMYTHKLHYVKFLAIWLPTLPLPQNSQSINKLKKKRQSCAHKWNKHFWGPEKEQKYREVRRLRLTGLPNGKMQRLPGIRQAG